MNTLQTALMQSSTPKPKNKPVGSANAVVPYDFNGDGFWMAKEEATDKDLACIISTEPDPLLDVPDDTWCNRPGGMVGHRTPVSSRTGYTRVVVHFST